MEIEKYVLPVSDKVLVRPEAAEEMSEGGIVIPDQARQMPGRGEVVAVGRDTEEVRVGEIVLYNKYDISLVEIEGEEFAILAEENLLVRIKK